MLSLDQLQQLRESSSTVDRLFDEIDLDDDTQLSIEVDPGELYQLLETWSFLYEAMRSFGAFNTVRAPGLPPRRS